MRLSEKKNSVLILFAKNPVEGKVKTRLCPPLSMSQAKEVAEFVLEESIKNALEYWPGKVELCIWPDLHHQTIKNLKDQYGFALSLQSKGDLGDKMFASMAEKRKQGVSSLIMGCDVPTCSAEIYKRAFDSLMQGCSVIGPTLDGGYYCIGTSHCTADMFTGVEWGSDAAMQQTLASCQKVGIEIEHRLPELQDLDTYEDLIALSSVCPLLKNFVI